MNVTGQASSVAPVRILTAALLRDFTTFQLGGPCRRMMFCETPEQATATVRDLLRSGEPFRLIGGGSNLLVADRGLDEVVVRFACDTPEIRVDGTRLEVSGATALDAPAAFAASCGLDGLTFANGIPGTVGGAVAGNAGAYGEQIADVLEAVELLERDGTTAWHDPASLGFAYRHSEIPARGAVVLRARLKLGACDPSRLQAERMRILALRREKHPDWRVTPCAGSFFRNLEPTSAAERRQAAGWFLEQAGALELRVGGAAVFPRHANMPIKISPDCTAADMRELVRRMAAAVRERFGIELVPEVRQLGFDA